MKRNKILIVVDMQNDFITGPLGTDAAKEILPNVVEKIKNWDGVVFATRDTHFDDYTQTQEGKYLPMHCVQGTEGWEINEDVLNVLENVPTINIVDKPTFGSMNLVEFVGEYIMATGLNEPDIEITLIGLCTDICVVSNALILKANFIESNISVDASCCAGSTPEGHNAAITTMKSCQINILNNANNE
jgi:nicotinamidase/pyrazinamidase